MKKTPSKWQRESPSFQTNGLILGFKYATGGLDIVHISTNLPNLKKLFKEKVFSINTHTYM